MKKISILSVVLFLVLTSHEMGCAGSKEYASKEEYTSTQDCDNTNPACSETVPTDEMCRAYFKRWFYDRITKSCKEIGYSGCSQKGFATEQACEECKCNEKEHKEKP